MPPIEEEAKSPDLHPIEQALYDGISACAFATYDKGIDTRGWTAALKHALKDIGQRFGCKTWATLHDDHEKQVSSEWLYDVCWMRYEEDWRNLQDIVLACEIEWDASPGSQLEDFLKLTVCTAQFRLFICTLPPARREERIRDFKTRCPGSRGNRYMVIDIIEKRPEALGLYAWVY